MMTMKYGGVSCRFSLQAIRCCWSCCWSCGWAAAGAFSFPAVCAAAAVVAKCITSWERNVPRLPVTDGWFVAVGWRGAAQKDIVDIYYSNFRSCNICGKLGHMCGWKLDGPARTTMTNWLVVSNMAFIFHNIWDNLSHWLIFFKMVKNHQPAKCVVWWCFTSLSFSPIICPNVSIVSPAGGWKSSHPCSELGKLWSIRGHVIPDPRKKCNFNQVGQHVLWWDSLLISPFPDWLDPRLLVSCLNK